jgi:hypothetical protein
MNDSVKFSRSPVDCLWRAPRQYGNDTTNASALNEISSGTRSTGKETGQSRTIVETFQLHSSA